MSSRCLVVLALFASEVQAEPLIVVPTQCEAFTSVELDHPMFWDNWLSLASCVTDSSVLDVRLPDQVESMAVELAGRLQPALMMYRDVLAGEAPVRAKLYAAYYTGSTSVAYMTRTRASLGGDPRTLQSRVARARLEPLLEQAKRLAWISFATIVAVSGDSVFGADPVSHAMISHARRMLELLEPPRDTKQDLFTAVTRAPWR